MWLRGFSLLWGCFQGDRLSQNGNLDLADKVENNLNRLPAVAGGLVCLVNNDLCDHWHGHGAGLSCDSTYGSRKLRQTLQRRGDRSANGLRLYRKHPDAHGIRTSSASCWYWHHACLSPVLCGSEHWYVRACLPCHCKEKEIAGEHMKIEHVEAIILQVSADHLSAFRMMK